MQLDHPEIFDVIYPGVEYNRIGNDEKIALQYTYALLDFFDRVYIMHRDGVIDDEMWKRWESWIVYSFTASGFFLKAWNSNCALYHAEFIAYIEQNFGDGSCGAAGSDVDISPTRQLATPTR
jgi:hypothetical protein